MDREKEEAFVAEEGILKGNRDIFEQTGKEMGQEAAALESILRDACAMALPPSDLQAASNQDNHDFTNARIRLFNDRDFFIEGYNYLKKEGARGYRDLEVTDKTVTLTAPADLKRRLGAPDQKGDVIPGGTAIPAEAWPRNGLFRLTDSTDRMRMAIEAARNTSGYWAGEQFCSDRHPIVQWVAERLAMQIPKGAAPFVASEHLTENLLCFCFIGQLSSRGGTPLVADAHAFTYGADGDMAQKDLQALLDEARLDRAKIQPVDLEMKAVRPLLHGAVAASLAHMRKLKEEHVKRNAPLIEREEQRLLNWMTERKEMLSAQMNLFEGQAPKSRIQKQIEEMEDYVRDRRRNWREMHFETAEDPTTQLVLVIQGTGG